MPAAKKTKKGSVSLKETKQPVAKVAQKVATPKPEGLSVALFSLAGKSAGSLSLPKEIFGAKVNKALVAQALRIYLNNTKSHHSNTKTRGEVEGSTRKVYRQKGTGRARHGGIRAPIYVGGGIALGPKSRKVVLDLPQKMKNAALVSVLSEMAKDKQVSGVSLEKANGKTKEMIGLARSVRQSEGKLKTVLVVDDGKNQLVQRALRNIKGIDFVSAGGLNVLEVVRHQSLLLTKEAVEVLEQRLLKKDQEAKQ